VNSQRRCWFAMVGPVLLLAFAAAALVSGSVGCGDAIDEALDGGELTGDDAFSQIYSSPQFQKCSGCHAPSAPGRTAGIEATQDWSTRDSAYSSLKGKASGLIGNFEGCNGVPLISSTANNSLLVASLDEDVRANFMNASYPDCTGDAISDQTLKIGGALPDSLLTQLKSWINAGAPNN
jgi:hypothetical protein